MSEQRTRSVAPPPKRSEAAEAHKKNNTKKGCPANGAAFFVMIF
jgi:hypothetical protein